MTHINDLLLERIYNIVEDDHGPRHGDTSFCGVPYTFDRLPPPADSLASFQLTPRDATQGLVMHATGEFRDATEVKWLAYHAPDLQGNPRLRELFCAFLERLRDETATAAHWNAFIVEHYDDTALERVRADCVRMMMSRCDGTRLLSDAERDTINSWISTLRH